MRVSGTSAAAASYGASSPKVQAPVRGDKRELQPSDGFASSQLPAGVGENLNIKA